MSKAISSIIRHRVQAPSSSVGRGSGALRQAALLAAVLLPLLLAAIAVSVWNWDHLGGVSLDRAGYVALGIGVVATLGLGIGLMYLVFYSNRHNYDDDADGS